MNTSSERSNFAQRGAKGAAGRFTWLFFFPQPIRFFLVRFGVDLWHASQFVLFLLVDALLLVFVRKGDSGAVLLVKMGELGDYVLFRNFLKSVRDHPAYKGRKIVLCANIHLRSLAEALDREWVDAFVWVDFRAFTANPFTRFRTLRRLKLLGAAVTLNPVYLRSLVGSDALVRASCANERIGFASQPAVPIWSEKTGKILWNPRWHQAIGDRFYTRLLPNPSPLFDFEINRIFFESVLTGTLLPRRPFLVPAPVEVPLPTGPFAVLLPGAGERFREWPVENFSAVARHLRERYHLAIVVTGTGADRAKAERIALSEDSLLDLTGKLSLLQLAVLLSRAAIVIANDSGGIHLAAALGRPGVGIATRSGLVHFHPYPPAVGHTIRFAYPRSLQEAISPEAYLAAHEHLPHLFASEVEVSAVIREVDECLQDFSGA
ncbi:ADP-heptose:LPS heptosyltransferase [Verrucomicrobium sp. GAS474]|uniref:glycosyltransferase family 9 protein n=1 Tax=Verrucomicrobium sp. GAS474 TaxID=1882831 RepID=UPI00087B139F|nr:glycosyltransferase family 9 protein [Verrucomicrobium sp. GAS474]SDU12711.1 ADP-heptose:LPS heptosyltransferase [Verrucomicrobium sp. GAS474]